jgi:hypothetical protein
MPGSDVAENAVNCLRDSNRWEVNHKQVPEILNKLLCIQSTTLKHEKKKKLNTKKCFHLIDGEIRAKKKNPDPRLWLEKRFPWSTAASFFLFYSHS